MKILSTTSWQRQGSCILFGLTEIQELLNQKAMVSLREFLSWRNNVPDDPPIPEDADTILVCGLETVMDTLSAEEAQEFLQYQVRPVIKNIQDIWTNTGVAFGFLQGSMSFKETNGSREEVLFLRSDNQEVHISEGLWDGTAELNMQRLETTFISDNQKVPIGYYVKRIS